MANAGPNTNSS